MSTLHGIPSNNYPKIISNNRLDNSNRLKKGQTWVNNGFIRYRILKLNSFEAVVYIFHRLNAKANRIKKYRRNSRIFNKLIYETNI